ncbi:MAG: TolC family outer membrane protein [Candidatus Azotimanducaceae bacterium]
MLKHCLLTISLLLLINQCLAASLQEVYELSVANDPELAAAQASFKAQKELTIQRKAGLLPSVSIGGSSTVGERWILSSNFPSEPSGSHGWNASLSQPIFRVDNWYRFRQGQDIKAQAAANFAVAQQALIVRVTESYLRILEAQAALTSAKAERDAVKRQLDQVQQRFDVGLVAITDVLEAQAAYDASIVSVIEQEGAQSISFEALLRLTGKTISEISGIIEEMPITAPNPNTVEDWIEKALSNNYSLIAANEGLKISQKDVKIARSGHLPIINANAVWSHNVTEGRTFLGSKTNNRSYSININIPLYQGGQIRSGARQALYNLDSAQENFDYLQRTVVENTRNLFTAIKTDVARVRARQRSIESSQSALEATRTGYEVGTRNIVEVLQAQRQLYLAQFQYASARYQYIRDNIRLKEIVGNLSPSDVYSLDKYIKLDGSVKRLPQ